MNSLLQDLQQLPRQINLNSERCTSPNVLLVSPAGFLSSRPPYPTSTPTSHAGRWSAEEHADFVVGFRQHGKDWKLIQELVGVRTLVQVRTHAQKWLQKNPQEEMGAASNVAAAKGGAASSPSASPPAVMAPARRKRKASRAQPLIAAACAIAELAGALDAPDALTPRSSLNSARFVGGDADPAFVLEVGAAIQASKAQAAAYAAAKAKAVAARPSRATIDFDAQARAAFASPSNLDSEVTDFCLPSVPWFGHLAASSGGTRTELQEARAQCLPWMGGRGEQQSPPSTKQQHAAPIASPISVVAPELSDILNFLDPNIGSSNEPQQQHGARRCHSHPSLLPSACLFAVTPRTPTTCTPTTRVHRSLTSSSPPFHCCYSTPHATYTHAMSYTEHHPIIMTYPAPIQVQDVHDPLSPRSRSAKRAKMSAGEDGEGNSAATLKGEVLYKLLEW